MPNRGGEDVPAVVVDPSGGATLTESQIREHLQAKLPEYLRPQYVGIWDEMPLTPTNKVQVHEVMEQWKQSR